MKSRNMIAPTLFLLALVGADAGGDAEKTTKAAAAEVDLPAPLNSLVVNPDHGQGLGPNGEDLHYGTREDLDDENKELFLRSLEEPTPVNEDAALAESIEKGATSDGGRASEGVVSAEH